MSPLLLWVEAEEHHVFAAARIGLEAPAVVLFAAVQVFGEPAEDGRAFEFGREQARAHVAVARPGHGKEARLHTEQVEGLDVVGLAIALARSLGEQQVQRVWDLEWRGR